MSRSNENADPAAAQSGKVPAKRKRRGSDPPSVRVTISHVEIHAEGDPDEIGRVIQGAFGLLAATIGGALAGSEAHITEDPNAR